jgi:hypothetical protein
MRCQIARYPRLGNLLHDEKIFIWAPLSLSYSFPCETATPFALIGGGKTLKLWGSLQPLAIGMIS